MSFCSCDENVLINYLTRKPHNAFCGNDETKNVKGTANRIVWISIIDNFQDTFFRQSLPKVLRQM